MGAEVDFESLRQTSSLTHLLIIHHQQGPILSQVRPQFCTC